MQIFVDSLNLWNLCIWNECHEEHIKFSFILQSISTVLVWGLYFQFVTVVIHRQCKWPFDDPFSLCEMSNLIVECCFEEDKRIWSSGDPSPIDLMHFSFGSLWNRLMFGHSCQLTMLAGPNSGDTLPLPCYNLQIWKLASYRTGLFFSMIALQTSFREKYHVGRDTVALWSQLCLVWGASTEATILFPVMLCSNLL